MRGYYGIGIERASKPMNAGNLFRTAWGFDASFVFTIDATFGAEDTRSDTSRAGEHLPYYSFSSADEMLLPKGCTLVGVELTDEAVALPTFRHPLQAAYILGPEKGDLSPEMQARCAHIVQIPTNFCLNVATAGAIIMYDRLLSRGSFADRPVKTGGPSEVQGGDEIVKAER